MHPKLIWLFVILLLSGNANGQNWHKLYPYNFQRQDLLDADYNETNGGIILYQQDSGHVYQYFLMRIDQNGEMLWKQALPNDSFKTFEVSVAILANGDCLFSGYVYIDHDHGYQALYRYDLAGNTIKKRYVKPDCYLADPGYYRTNHHSKVISRSDGGYYYVYYNDSIGHFGNIDTAYSRTYIEKIDAADNSVWTKNREHAYRVTQSYYGSKLQPWSFRKTANDGIVYELNVDVLNGTSFVPVNYMESRDSSGNITWTRQSRLLIPDQGAGYICYSYIMSTIDTTTLLQFDLYKDAVAFDTLRKQVFVRLDAHGNVMNTLTHIGQPIPDGTWTFPYLDNATQTSNGNFLFVTLLDALDSVGLYRETSGITTYDEDLNYIGFTPNPVPHFISHNKMIANSSGGIFMAYTPVVPNTKLSMIEACNVDSDFHTYPGMIGGTITKDNNYNCIADNGDNARISKFVALHEQGGGDWYAITDSAGNYVTSVPPGSFTVEHAPADYYASECPASGTYSYNVTTTTNITNADFHDTLTQNVKDLAVTFLPGTFVTGWPFELELMVANNGTITSSGILSVILDSNVSYSSATPNPQSVSGDTLRFNINNLPALGVYNIQVQLNNQSGTLGTQLMFTGSIPLTGDTLPNNNQDTLFTPIVGSYDPNDKASNRPLYMHGEDEILYTIRFQNTGTYYARNIVVEDSISENLDLGSFRFLSSSHAKPEISIKDKRVVVFNFKDIYLPDSNMSEPASHGKFTYSIKTRKHAQVGDTILNSAGIYFDFNSAVITNTTMNIIGDTTVIEYPTHPFPKPIDIVMYPNPSDGKGINIIVPDKKTEWEVYISDITGKEVLHHTYPGNSRKISFDIDKLTGVYFVQILNKAADIRIMNKLLIQK